MSRATPRILLVDIVSLLALAASFVATLAMWSNLPDRVPIHFDIHGVANGFASRAVGAFLLPALAAGVWLLVRFGTGLLPVGEGRNGLQARATASAACALTVFLLALHVSSLRAAATGRLSSAFFPIALGGFCLALTVLLPCIRRNVFIGIRTPWALASDENWARTHRVASFTMLGAAVACFLAPLFATPGLALPVASVLFAALVPAIYSAVIAHRSTT